MKEFLVDATIFVVGGVLVGVPTVALFGARPHRKLMRVLGASWALLTLPPYAVLFAIPDLTFVAATAGCGHAPVIATNFAAAWSYDLPGDQTYGPSLFTSGYYCSSAEAERAGYHRNPLGRPG